MRVILLIFSIMLFSSQALASYECDSKTVKGGDYEKEIIVHCGEANGFTIEKIYYQSKPGTDLVFKYGGKVIHRLNQTDYSLVSLEKFFNIKEKKVLLVGLSTGGTACPMLYMFITIMPDGTGKVTEEFGTCSDLITVSQKDDTITVTMPDIGGRVKKTYIYKDGYLVKGDKPGKK